MPIEAVNPATGKSIKTYTETTPEQVNALIEQADRAWHDWRRTSFGERTALMRNVAHILRDNCDQYAVLTNEDIRRSGATSLLASAIATADHVNPVRAAPNNVAPPAPCKKPRRVIPLLEWFPPQGQQVLRIGPTGPWWGSLCKDSSVIACSPFNLIPQTVRFCVKY